jgi:hypothetical protein
VIGITESNILQSLWQKFPGKSLHNDPDFYEAKRYLRWLCGSTAFVEITPGMIRIQMKSDDMIKIRTSVMPE